MSRSLRVAGCMLAGALMLAGCATAPKPVKIGLTPLTVVRDAVDVPLFTLTNIFEFFADHTRPAKTPHAGVGWSWRGGFNFGIGYDVSYFLFKPCSWILGAVDYLPCRSLYPSWPEGVSPWTEDGDRWGKYYFPNTRALWREPMEETPPPAVQPATRETFGHAMVPRDV